MKKEFIYLFQIDKRVLFEVQFRTCGSDTHPYFITYAHKFYKNKRGFEATGQCQCDVLEGLAYNFFKKYCDNHYKNLSEEEYNNIVKDLEELKQTYNYKKMLQDTFKEDYSDFSFEDMKELSRKEIKINLKNRYQKLKQ